MANPNDIQVNSGIITWLLGTMGSLVVFLLGLGFYDIRKKMNKIDTLCLEVEKLRGTIGKDMAELRGDVARLEQEVETYKELLK